MVYIFGNGKDISVVFDEKTMTEKDKTNGLKFANIPEVEQREGFIARLALNDANELYWFYDEIIEEE